MNLANFGLIFAGVLLNAVAQLFLKAGTNEIGALNFNREQIISTVLKISLEPYILAGLTCYVLSVAIWIVALSKVDVSVAYPMLSMGYVVNIIAAWYLFGETISPQKIVGIATIILGVYIIARS